MKALILSDGKGDVKIFTAPNHFEIHQFLFPSMKHTSFLEIH